MFLPGVGGAERSLSCLLDEMHSENVDFFLLVPYRNWRYCRKNTELLYSRKIFPILPGYQKLAKISINIAHIFLSFQLTIVQRLLKPNCWHAVGAFPIGAMLAKWSSGRSVRCVIRAPGEDIQIDQSIGYGVRLDKSIDKFLVENLQFADAFIAHSRSIYSEYKKIGIRDEKIVEVPNGVYISRFARRKTNVEQDQRPPHSGSKSGNQIFKFLFVGRNHPKKGLETLIEATRILSSKNSRPFIVELVGRNVDQLASTTNRLGIAQIFSLRGEIRSGRSFQEHPSQELAELYQQADVFVLPSLLESFGVVLIEAMAAGLPVITTDTDGCRDVIRGGKDGIMVPKGDAQALASAMARLLEDSNECAKYELLSRKRAEDFDWEKLARMHIQLYCQLSTPAKKERSL